MPSEDHGNLFKILNSACIIFGATADPRTFFFIGTRRNTTYKARQTLLTIRYLYYLLYNTSLNYNPYTTFCSFYIYTCFFENRINESFIFFEVVLTLRLSLNDTVSKLRSKEVFLFMSAVFLHLICSNL